MILLINEGWDIASPLIMICNNSLLNLNTPSFHFPNVIVSWVPSSMSNQQPKEFSLTTYKIEFLFHKHLRSYFLMKYKLTQKTCVWSFIWWPGANNYLLFLFQWCLHFESESNLFSWRNASLLFHNDLPNNYFAGYQRFLPHSLKS